MSKCCLLYNYVDTISEMSKFVSCMQLIRIQSCIRDNVIVDEPTINDGSVDDGFGRLKVSAFSSSVITRDERIGEGEKGSSDPREKEMEGGKRREDRGGHRSQFVRT